MRFLWDLNSVVFDRGFDLNSVVFINDLISIVSVLTEIFLLKQRIFGYLNNVVCNRGILFHAAHVGPQQCRFEWKISYRNTDDS